MLEPSEYWDREVTSPVTPPSHSWTAHPRVRRYVNRSISGHDDAWPLDWFQDQYRGRVFDLALSIGCGTGALERDLVRRGVAKAVEAFDASRASIEVARDKAATEGFGSAITYSVADFNTVELPRAKFDLICFHQSLHHVEALEHLLLQVKRSLKPSGMLYLDEFVGPSRTFWNLKTLEWYRAAYHLLPGDVRAFHEFEMPVQQEDPSEAIRSGEILSRLAIGFHVDELRGYGGNVLAMFFPELVVERLTDDQVDAMIAAEERLLASGASHFHAVIVARPKRGAASLFADVRYYVEDRFPQFTKPLRAIIRRLRP